MKANNFYRYSIGTLLILLLPLVAMVFTDEVQWKLFDFIVMGALLMGAAVAYEFVLSRLNPKHRLAVAVIFVAAILLMWVELAVGIFGLPFAGS